MDKDPEWTTMEELLEEAADTEEEDRILDRLKLVAQESLPEGWTNWRTLNLSKENLLGSDNEVDPQILNKLRFALPTVGMAKAFNPSAVDLPEKQYRDLKVSMLNWPFCRALIMSPPALVNKLRGSISQAEIFLHAIQPVKHLCISRKQAAVQLRPELSDSDSENQENIRPQGGKRPGFRSDDKGPIVKRSKYVALEEQMNHMFEILLNKIELIKEQGNKKRGGEESSEDCRESESDQDSFIEEAQSLASTAWLPPRMEDSPAEPENDLEALSLAPQVKEKEPSIPPPAPEIKAHGISCQKLGSVSWNKIRYKEVQKKLHASPVFDSLKVNAQLESLIQKSFHQTLLERMDEMAGTLSHGLLKQRQKLMEGLKSLATKHPEAYGDIKEVFLGDSQFKEISDDLLQFTCARRAEVIEMRRKAFKPKEQHHAAKLAEITPSESHLFDEELLSKFLDQRGGLSKVFPSARRPFKKRPFYGMKNKPSQRSNSTGNAFLQKSRQPSTGNTSFRKPASKDSRKYFKRSNTSTRDRR